MPDPDAMPAGLRITPAIIADTGELFTVQRAAYVSEAQRYADPHIPPLTESLAEVRESVRAGDVLVARIAGRLVGGVRGVRHGDLCRVGRLVVAPDMQGRGIGTSLLVAVERAHAGRVHAMTLFTGADSADNLRLYHRLGYRETHTERINDHLSFVHLSKPLGGHPARS